MVFFSLFRPYFHNFLFLFFFCPPSAIALYLPGRVFVYLRLSVFLCLERLHGSADERGLSTEFFYVWRKRVVVFCAARFDAVGLEREIVGQGGQRKKISAKSSAPLYGIMFVICCFSPATPTVFSIEVCVCFLYFLSASKCPRPFVFLTDSLCPMAIHHVAMDSLAHDRAQCFRMYCFSSKPDRDWSGVNLSSWRECFESRGAGSFLLLGCLLEKNVFFVGAARVAGFFFFVFVFLLLLWVCGGSGHRHRGVCGVAQPGNPKPRISFASRRCRGSSIGWDSILYNDGCRWWWTSSRAEKEYLRWQSGRWAYPLKWGGYQYRKKIESQSPFCF